MAGMDTRFRELSRNVPIPHPWDLTTYLDSVAEYRGRAITLQPVDTAVLAGAGCGTGSGLWIAKHDSDVIVYGADTTEWHAEHIIAHELGHMLLGHGPDPAPADDCAPTTETLSAVAELLPSIAPESIRHVLGRTDYGNTRERDAETFADLVMLQAMRPPRRDSLLHRTFFRDRRR
ncbi:ImmA/IrrE family metallo-endopeptidase [Nocardia sp. NPDC050710]|uniref:ImmA/IrrE family metallo-endopeptidase n=1 Tax=Nocardia sp. NPDC050710 TaxID=3157220 RepID=UPI0033F629AA